MLTTSSLDGPHEAEPSMVFFGRFLKVTDPRIDWHDNDIYWDERGK